MTPFDDAKPRPVDPGETQPAPNDPGDEIELRDRRIVALTRWLDEAQARLEEQGAEIKRLQVELHEYRQREREILDVIARHQRQDAYRRVHMRVAPYPEGLGGTGQCDCTMGRAALLSQEPSPLIQPNATLRARVERAILSMAKG